MTGLLPAVLHLALPQPMLGEVTSLGPRRVAAGAASAAGRGWPARRAGSAAPQSSARGTVQRAAGVPEALAGLPLVELPARDPTGDVLAVLLSGDGGWRGLDHRVGAFLSASGIPVVGWNSLEYFWKRRTPMKASADLSRVLRYYMHTWHKGRVILVGYSRGADVLPFMASRLPPALQRHVGLVALLGPEHTIDFRFHLTDWIHSVGAGLPVLPEVRKLHGMHILCVYGAAEKDTICPQLEGGPAETVEVPGAHHFDHAYDRLGALVLQASEWQGTTG